MAMAADSEDRATSDANALLDGLFAAITAGDIDAVAAVYDDEIQVWHNITDRAVDKRAGLAILRWYVKTVSSRHYEIVERRHWPGGVMQRHVLHGQVGDAVIRAPVCITFELRDGQIVAIHEYVDSAAIAAMMPSS
jgi:ketosteroid isomerase-like protein